MRCGVLKKLFKVASLAFVVLLAGCGGGGGGGGTVASGNGGSNPISGSADNVQPIAIDSGPVNTVNILFTSVIICIPGTADCRTIDHIQVDTGSNGLRIMSTLLPSSFILPQQTNNGNAVAECAQFADGSSWGPVKIADVKLAGEVAASVPVQIIGDPNFTEPNECINTGPSENTVETFGSNGILGVGVFKQDCGNFCASNASNGFYYICPCDQNMTSSALSLDLQVANPVPMFANDNNGVIVELPAIPSTGQATVSGSLVFGIGTQSNNTLGPATVFKASTDTGYFITTYKGHIFNFSLLDSGTSAYFFPDSNLSACNQAQDIALGFYCPASTQSLTATIKGTDGVSTTVGFSVGNAHNLFTANPDYTAFNNIAVPQSGAFIWGLPAFFGRNVFTAIEGQNTSAGPGPYFAF